MASSTPPYAWRVTGKPKRPSPLFFYRFDFYGNIRDAIWSLIWKSFFILLCVVLAFIIEGVLFSFNTTPTLFWILFFLTFIVVGGLGVWLFFSDDWRTAKHSYHMDMEKYQERLSILKQKHPLPIIGHEQFRRSVERVLDELQTCAPHRYREAIGYFEKAEYYDWSSKDFAGRSDGYFSIDGSGDNSQGLNTYEWFRFVFLHEVGHKVHGTRDNDWKEKTADSYANTVLQEMGFRPYR